MRKQIIQAGVDTQVLFRIECADSGYFAVRDHSPRFALFGQSIEGVAASAARALAIAAIQQSPATDSKE